MTTDFERMLNDALDEAAAECRRRGLRGCTGRDAARVRLGAHRLYRQERAKMWPWLAAGKVLWTLMLRTVWPL